MQRVVLFFSLLIALPAYAQSEQEEIGALKEDIDLFAEVLEEALDLDEGSGLFGLSLGGIDPVYIRGQGLVVEVRSQLSTRRNRLNLAALNSTMQSLRTGTNPFDAFRQRNGNSVAAASSDTPVVVRFAEEANTQADSFYDDMMQRVANVDYSLVINTAIQQAANSIRSLRSLGDVGETEYQQMLDELNALRSRLTDSLTAVREVESEAQNTTAATDAEETDLSTRMNELLAGLEPLRDEALAKARDLQQRMEQAEADYSRQWREDIFAFEVQLYEALCDFSAPLRHLPDQETLAFVLQGLGEETDSQSTDKVHIVPLVEIRRCQQAQITAQQLQTLATTYSY